VDVTSEWVQAAHGDAWQELGRQRAGTGGGTCELPGIRLMATGLAHPQWNNGDVDNPAAVDIETVRRWYAEKAVPWGVRVPRTADWPFGRKLLTKRLMGLTPSEFSAAPAPAGVRLRTAGPGDAEAVLGVDSVAFDTSIENDRPWLEPMLSEAAVTVVLAEIEGEPVGTGYGVLADGVAGRSLYLAGIGVLPTARRRGIAGALSSLLVERGVAQGAEIVHLHPDTDAAASVYRRLGFAEVSGFDVYVDNDEPAVERISHA
jgi:ribosomal protein S18 acetylase RimI-like enzyme